MLNKLALSVLFSVALATVSNAASVASDNAGNYGSTANWTNGSNLGTGFGAWGFNTTGGGGNFIGGTGVGNPSFGIFSPAPSDQFLADRSFTGGALSIGQTFSLTLSATGVNSTTPGVIGLNLFDTTTSVFTFKFTGGGSFWQLNDGGSDFNTNIPFSSNAPINFSFTFNGGASYTVSISDGTNTFGGTPFNANDTISNITGFRMFSTSQGAGENLGFNNLAVVPEPTTLSLFAGPAILGAWFFIRRRRA